MKTKLFFSILLLFLLLLPLTAAPALAEDTTTSSVSINPLDFFNLMKMVSDLLDFVAKLFLTPINALNQALQSIAETLATIHETLPKGLDFIFTPFAAGVIGLMLLGIALVLKYLDIPLVSGAGALALSLLGLGVILYGAFVSVSSAVEVVWSTFETIGPEKAMAIVIVCFVLIVIVGGKVAEWLRKVT